MRNWMNCLLLCLVLFSHPFKLVFSLIDASAGWRIYDVQHESPYTDEISRKSRPTGNLMVGHFLHAAVLTYASRLRALSWEGLPE